MNQITPGTSFRGYTSIIGNQPPKNKVTVNALIKIIFAYSPKKNKANDIEEYSTHERSKELSQLIRLWGVYCRDGSQGP